MENKDLIERQAYTKQLDAVLKENVNHSQDLDHKIIAFFCRTFNISESDLKGRSRKAEIVGVRQLCQYFLHKKVYLSLSATGRIFGRDHSTVIHSIQTVNNRVETERDYREKFTKLTLLIEML
jgi:chromosomal replication initiator protein